MRRIVFVMPYFFKDGYGGGAELQAYLKSKYLSNKNFDVIYITSNPSMKPKSENVDGINVLRVLKMPFALRNTFKVFRYILKLKPHFIYLRMNWSLILPVVIVGKIMRSRIFWFATEDASIDYFFHTKVFLSAVRKFGFKFKYVPLFFYYILEDISFVLGIFLVDKLFVQNSYQKQALKRKFFRNSEIFKSVHEVKEEGKIVKSTNPLVIWVGNVGRRKRPEIFLELCSKLNSLDFVMVGKMNPNYPLDFNRCKSLKFLGRLSFEETERLFERAWFYVNTSISKREGFPNTFIQAWKYKTVVISFGVNPDNLLTEKKLGFVVGSVDEAVNIINRLISDRKMREEIVRRAYVYVRENHDIEKSMEKFIKDHLQTP